MYEHEAKLHVPERFDPSKVVPDLTALGLEVGAPKTRTIVDVYHDTEDLRLLRWGCTIRHRRRKGWTVKLPVASRVGELVRDEIDLGGRAGRFPADGRRLIASFARSGDLGVVATMTTDRTTRSIRSADGAPVGELTDDRVSAQVQLPGCENGDGSGEPTTFRQLEVELAPEVDPTVLSSIVDVLEAAGGRPQANGIKLALALGLSTLEPDVTVQDLPADPTAADVIGRTIARSVRQLIIELPVARMGVDPRGVHRARVATRRLRADLRTFKPLVEPEWADSLGNGLRELAAALGKVRDADVLAPLLRSALAERPDIDPVAGEEMLDLLTTRRSQALAELDNYLDQPETVALLDDLVAAAASPATNRGAERPAKEALPHLVDKRWRKLNRAVDRLDRTPKPEKLHDIRILAKRNRYATEAVAPGFGRRTKRFGKSLAGLQDTLGDLNDRSTAVEWLGHNAADLSPTTAYWGGRLAQQLADRNPPGINWRQDWKAVRKARPNWLRRPQ